MAHPTHCVQHDRAITPDSWALFERAVYIHPMTHHCACGISEEEREALRYVELCAAREALKAPHKKDVGSTEYNDNDYWFFITITQPPGNTVDRIDKVTKKFIKSKQIDTTEWAYCLELTAIGTPHSHIRCKTKRKYLDAGKLKKLNDNYRIEVAKETFGSDAYISDPQKLHAKTDWFFCSENYTGKRPELA